MKTRLLMIFAIIGLFISFIPHSFGNNEFCNIMEDLKNQEELIKDDIVLIEFLNVLPNAKLTRATGVDESNSAQTSMTWSTGVYSLDISISGYDWDNPSDCFFPVGYRLNAPHLPEMIGLDYHKDPLIVLEQIDELEPKYVKGGPKLIEPMPSSCRSGPAPDGNWKFIDCKWVEIDSKQREKIIVEQICGPETELVDGICQLISDGPTHTKPSIFLDGFIFLILFSPFFIPGAVIFVVLSKTPRYSGEIRIAVCIAAILVLLYFLWTLFVGVYPPGYA